VLWGGRPDIDIQLGAWRNMRRAIIRRAGDRLADALEAGDVCGAQQAFRQAAVTSAAQESADRGGVFVLSHVESLEDERPLHPQDAALLKEFRRRRCC